MNRRSASGIGFAFSEGWRNAAASRVMGVVVVALSALIFGGVAAADGLSVARLSAEEDAWVAAGGNVLVVSNQDGLSARDCELLNRADGVRAAVGIQRQLVHADLSNGPDANLAVFGVTAGITGFLTTPSPLDSVLVSQRTATQNGLESGQWIGLTFTTFGEESAEQGTTSGTVVQGGDSGMDNGRYALPGLRIVTVNDLGIFGDEYSSGIALLMPASGDIDACFVWAEPGAKEVLRGALPGILPGFGDKPTIVADRLITGQFSRDYYGDYLARAWRWIPLPAGAGLGLIWVLLRWVRRSEDGLYQSLGVGRSQRALLRQTEWAIYTGIGAGLGLAGSIICADALAPTLATIVPHLVRATLLGLAAALLVGSLASLLPARNPLDALKDR